MQNKWIKNHPNHQYYKRSVFVIIVFLILITLFLAPKWIAQYVAQKADIHRLKTESYDAVFLSMYPITFYQEEDFTTYRAITTVKLSTQTQKLKDLNQFLNTAASSGNPLSTIYLGIDPFQLWKDAGKKEDIFIRSLQTHLVSLMQSQPETQFELLLSYPSLSYWEKHNQELEQTITAMQVLLTLFSSVENAAVYYFGSEEWLIANPGNYVEEFDTNEAVSRTIMLNTDQEHPYLLTLDNAEAHFTQLRALVHKTHTAENSYPDWSGWDIVFFGDSIIGNFSDSMSIPDVISNLTGAQSYNLGYGGNSAAMQSEILISLPGITQAFIQEDLSALPEDTQVAHGMKSYLERPDSDNKICFVINYGLNDYFSGLPVSSIDPYDIYTYSGAVRSAVKTLQEAYPDAPILLLAPSFTTYFSYGMDKTSEVGGQLTDYVDAIVSLSQEWKLPCLNSYTELGITPENELEFLGDGCHPNEAGRFLMGNKIIERLSTFLN